MASNSMVTMGVGTQEAAARATDSQEVVATAVVSAATGTAAKDLAMDSVRWEVVEAAEGAVVEAAGKAGGGRGDGEATGGGGGQARQPVHDLHLHIGHLSSRLSEHHDKQVSKLKSFS